MNAHLTPPCHSWLGSQYDVVRAALAAVEAGQPVIRPKLVNQVIAALSKRMPEALRYQMGKLNFLE